MLDEEEMMDDDENMELHDELGEETEGAPSEDDAEDIPAAPDSGNERYNHVPLPDKLTMELNGTTTKMLRETKSGIAHLLSKMRGELNLGPDDCPSEEDLLQYNFSDDIVAHVKEELKKESEVGFTYTDLEGGLKVITYCCIYQISPTSFFSNPELYPAGNDEALAASWKTFFAAINKGKTRRRRSISSGVWRTQEPYVALEKIVNSYHESKTLRHVGDDKGCFSIDDDHIGMSGNLRTIQDEGHIQSINMKKSQGTGVDSVVVGSRATNFIVGVQTSRNGETETCM